MKWRKVTSMLKQLILIIVLLCIGIVGAILISQPSIPDKNLQVQVLDSETLTPLQGARVSIYDQDQNLVEETTSDPNGVVELKLSPGYYYVNVSLPGYSEEEKMVNVFSDSRTTIETMLKKEIHALCEENWSCTDWGKCVDGVQKRTCTDVNQCGTTKKKPPETKECKVFVMCENDADCSTGNPCNIDKCVNGICSHMPVTQCKSGDVCCPVGCDSSNDADCKQGPKTFCSNDSDCSTSLPCVTFSCNNGVCNYLPVSECKSGDGCCPSGCDATTDSDCVSCKFNTDCFDNDPCTVDKCVNGKCEHTQITTCSGDTQDECCPSGCTIDNDKDCNACDTDADCNDGNVCTIDLCTGSPRSCEHRPIITCGSSDGCCPTGCTNDPSSNSYDPDCTAKGCNNNYDCDDGIDCTEDICDFTTFTCKNEPISECKDNDGCCPSQCTPENDNDCSYAWYCTNDSECADTDPCTINERCVNNECTSDWVACGLSDGCCPPTCYPEGQEPIPDPDCSPIEPPSGA